MLNIEILLLMEDYQRSMHIIFNEFNMLLNIKLIPSFKAQQAYDINVFFTFAQKSIPQLNKNITMFSTKEDGNKEGIDQMQQELETYKLATLIAKRNVEGLNKISEEQLGITPQIIVPAKFFKDQMNGLLHAKGIGGENALALVIFHSALDTTPEEQQKTLKMLRILIDKGLNINAQVGDVFFVKDHPGDKRSLDYVENYPLVIQALIFSYPTVLELLLKHGARYDREMVDAYLKMLKEKNIPAIEKFEKIFAQYTSQEARTLTQPH